MSRWAVRQANHARLLATAAKSKSDFTSTTHVVTTASGGGGGLHACDRNISANTATTCDFATSVFQSYAAEDQSGASPSTDIVTSSSATAQTYKMSCNYDGSQVTCTGGDNALVTFPKWAADVY